MDDKIEGLIQAVRESLPLRGRYAALAALADAAGPLAEEVERLTIERAALLAPAGGVDLEEVLRLDREGTPAERWTVDTGEWREDDRYVRQVVVNKYEEVTQEYDFDDFPARAAELAAALAPIKTDGALITLYRTAAPALAREVAALRAAVRFVDEQSAKAIERVSSAIVADKWSATAAFQERALKAEAEVARLRDHLDTARRLLPPRYIAADGSILDPQRCTPHARDCAECGRGRAHDEECLGVRETPSEEVARLRAALEEARLTLSAEQGRAEGAPRERGAICRWSIEERCACPGPHAEENWHVRWTGEEPTARAAMLAADAAMVKP